MSVKVMGVENGRNEVRALASSISSHRNVTHTKKA
jgi:hypothetical protein